MAYELGEVLFQRVYESRNAEGVSGVVTLYIGRPQPDASKTGDSGEPLWLCPHLITGIDDERVFPAWGEDALEALLICLQTAASILEHFGSTNGNTITWKGRENLRLPVMNFSGDEDVSPNQFRGFEEAFEAFFREMSKKR